MSAEHWEQLLDRMEEDANRILDAPEGTAAAHDLQPWTQPETPLPAHLADRARAVIDRQRAAMDRTRTDLDGLRQHLGAVRRVPAPQPPDAPAYLDVDG
ncbi:hypothetical protein [Microbacterium sp. p3-SID336]|uniref:hypothetical protein n=1 Tax=Microbacterium sp. p3-SID336 TaxID=2916212 RepID=UPI0021A5CED1|nr:hypothetical protein [Microbacterium sp. p3-SID336]MCT1477846.1 hypothetical protein [Microbacterium sp. p3-SID336]